MLKYRYFLLYVLALGCKTKNDRPPSEEASSINRVSEGVPVTLSVVESATFRREIISNGRIEALQKTELRFKTSERIASIPVKNGQKVASGQVLAILDNAILANQLDKAKIELDKAKIKLQEEKINYGISTSNTDILDDKIHKSLKMKSGLYEAENALESAQLLYDQSVIKAPFSGIVANIEVKTGNFITSSDVFCTLINPKTLEVSFFILENELNFLSKNQEISVVPFADDSKKYRGTITEINPLVDDNGLMRIRATLSDNDSTLFDGMNVRVTISKEINDRIVIPKEALVLRSNREVIFNYENGLAKWKYVKILDENSDSYALIEGVKLGDTLIISGNMNLAHDARVHPVNSGN